MTFLFHNNVEFAFQVCIGVYVTCNYSIQTFGPTPLACHMEEYSRTKLQIIGAHPYGMSNSMKS